MAPWVLWLALVIVLGIIEAATVNLVTIWFVAGGIAAMVVSMFTDNFFICFAVFVILSVILLVCTRPILKKYVKAKPAQTNLDRVIGMTGYVTEDITNEEPGEVKADGKRWTAVSDEALPEGTKVTVLKIDGVKLIVSRQEN